RRLPALELWGQPPDAQSGFPTPPPIAIWHHCGFWRAGMVPDGSDDRRDATERRARSPDQERRRHGDRRNGGLRADGSDEFSAYEAFTRAEWAGLRSSTPLTLSEEDLASLRGVNDLLSLTDVEEIYLPLS